MASSESGLGVVSQRHPFNSLTDMQFNICIRAKTTYSGFQGMAEWPNSVCTIDRGRDSSAASVFGVMV